MRQDGALSDVHRYRPSPSQAPRRMKRMRPKYRTARKSLGDTEQAFARYPLLESGAFFVNVQLDRFPVDVDRRMLGIAEPESILSHAANGRSRSKYN
jgi:hypothetical protein